jgi:Asp-tRNA(Asn)/Glu-tRNA(Gln) amidotransferase A subunit family amidase
MTFPHALTLVEAARSIREGGISPVDLVEALLARIDLLDGKIQAWAAIDRPAARLPAAELDREAQQGRFRGPLHGVPVGIKDIFYTAGLETAAGSKVLAGFVPDYDAEAVARLRRAGAIILGKLATAEFAFADAPATRNPWNLEHTPGGSSSGAGAAVAARMCYAAIGSQTIGSTIRPASYCGIVGMKPTFGLVSRYGMLPLAPSLDHVGILARCVADAAAMLQALAGHDSRDIASRRVAAGDYRLDSAAPPPRIAVMPKSFDNVADDETRAAVAATVSRFVRAGAQIETVPEPSGVAETEAVATTILGIEAAASHRESFAEKKNSYGPKMRQFLERSLKITAQEYMYALESQSRFRAEVDRVLVRFDAILTPATPSPAPAGIESTGDPSFNRPWSLSGHPVISLPCALTASRLPISIQLTGGTLQEVRLLNIARWCEKVLGFDAIPDAAPL